MPRLLAQQASIQTEREELARQSHDLEARELEVEQRTKALNLNAVRDARATAAAPVAGSIRSRTQKQAHLKPKHASSQVASQRSLVPTQGLPSGIKAQPQAHAQTQPLDPAQPPRLAPAYFLSQKPLPSWGLDACL